ncbi:hypothetical protein HZ65_001172 [Escherichia coli]|nr:hypothetical protein [Escherichia coli]
MATNNFKPFGIGAGANVTSQADYEALAALLTGFQSGKASSAQINKALRQSTVMASVLAQFISDSAGVDVLDNGNTAQILANLKTGMTALTPGRLLNIQVFYNSGTYTPTIGTKKVIVEMVGGGGGGAGARAAGPGQVAVGGAGGAGSYAKGQFTSGFSGVQVTVGSKGLGGTVSDPYASVGGTSSFGSLMTAAGGDTGTPAGPTSSFPFSTVAAVVSGGATGANIIGTPGEGASSSAVISSSVIVDAPGGSSHFGAGGFITATNTNGAKGSGYGSGGGPSSVTAGNAAVAGGDGAPGLVIIWEYA